MKRWATRILVFLLLGAIVNVPVAWGCAARGQRMPKHAWPFAGMYSEPLDQSDTHWLQRAGWRQRTDQYCTYPAMLFEWGSAFGFTHRGYAEDRVPRSIDDAFSCQGLWGYSVFAQQLRAGWPSKSMIGGVLASPIKLVETVEWPTGRYLPLRPIWPGFAINTVFYAAILWLLFALGGTPFALRRWRRVRKGLCPKCGYDLRGGRHRPSDSAICPECGGSLCRRVRIAAP